MPANHRQLHTTPILQHLESIDLSPFRNTVTQLKILTSYFLLVYAHQYFFFILRFTALYSPAKNRVIVTHRYCTCELVQINVISVSENCTICEIFRISAHCLTCLQGLCSECDRLYHSYPERANHHRTAVTSSSPCSSSQNRNSYRSGTIVLIAALVLTACQSMSSGK